MAHDDASPKTDVRTCPLAEINAFDPAILDDPYPYFERLRAEAPVFRDPKTGIVSVSTYDLIMEVNRQPGVFSNSFGEMLRSGAAPPDPETAGIMSQGWIVPDTMLTADPPVHTRFRKLGGKAFTFKRVEQMGDYVAKVTNDLIDTFIDDGACEFKSSLRQSPPDDRDRRCAGRAAPRHGSFPSLVGRLRGPARRRLRQGHAYRSGAPHRRVPALFRRSHRGEAAQPLAGHHFGPRPRRPRRGGRSAQDGPRRTAVDPAAAAGGRQRDHRPFPDRRHVLPDLQPRSAGTREATTPA